MNSHTWRVAHRPAEPLALVFELGPTRHRASVGPPEYYLPILEPGLLHALGAQTLPAPTHLDFALERPITLAWRGFEGSGWHVASSFGLEQEVRTSRSLDAFRHALFLAGDLRLATRDVHGGALCVALTGKWSFSDEDFTRLAAGIVAQGREFFSDFEQPFYLISLIAVGSPGERSSSYGGTGLTDSFALFVTAGMTLAPMEGGGGIAWLLTHELFHEWNGQTISLAQPEQLGYWFSEGFTDFYTRRLLLRAGRLDGDAVAASWNKRLAELAANPARDAPAERVLEAFWTDAHVGNLPYLRGDVIALYVDDAIRRRSQGERSLDDLMRELVRRARGGEADYSNDELIAAIGELAGEETARVVRAWAVDGREPSLAGVRADPELELEPAEVPTFDLGFEHEATLRDGLVRGVRAGGCAESAGLRDGMRFASWSVHFGNMDQPVEIVVLVDGAERRIRYLPRGAPVSGYRVRARAR